MNKHITTVEATQEYLRAAIEIEIGAFFLVYRI